MPGTSSIGGIISGLSTDDIISKIMSVAKQPVTDLTTKQADLTKQLSAWQEFNTRILALQTSSLSLADPTNFASNGVTSSDETLLTGTADATAASGTYYITVTSKAQTQQLASQGFASLDSAVGKGTIHFAMADSSVFDIKVDDNNNSLTGLRDSINKSGQGVSAVIVNTGDAAKPYQLLVTSKGSGTKNAMTITSDSTDAGKIAINQVVQAASDATLELGSGAGKISITKSTNSITDVIPGVTLNVNNFDTSKTVTLQVSTDTASIEKKVNDFVTQYNNIVDFLNAQFTFDMQGNSQGVLFGDYQLQILQSDLSSSIMTPAAGLSQDLKSLAQVGITVGTDGKLSVNTGTLDDALSNKLSQVNALFSTGFDSSTSDISMVTSSPDTEASSANGYEVKITTQPLRARITSGVAQDAALGQAETISINNVSVQLDKDMTQAQVVARINSYTDKTGVTALATGADGTGTGSYLTLQQNNYGVNYHISAVSSQSNTSSNTSGLGGTSVTDGSAGESGTQGVAGQDVVGTINGIDAKANGQFLTAQPGGDGRNPAQGLCLKIDASTPTTASVHFTKGVGLLIKDLVSKATSTQGGVTTAENTINTQISDIKKQIDDLNARLDDKQAQLYDQFNKMETALGKLQQQGSAISSLVGSLNSGASSSSSKSSSG